MANATISLDSIAPKHKRASFPGKIPFCCALCAYSETSLLLLSPRVGGLTSLSRDLVNLPLPESRASYDLLFCSSP